MNHFTLGEWTDFVRKLKGRSATAQMQQHLDQGCRQCLKVVRIWKDLFAFMSNERRWSPPDRALRSVRGYYSSLKAGKRESRVAAIARLLFDSFLEPVPAGLRSSQSSPRQLVYSAGSLLIDLRLERRVGRISIVGQAQRRSPSGRRIAPTEVLLVQESKRVARTRCNQFGEFQFSLRSEAGEHVSIILKGPKTFVVPLQLAGLPPSDAAR